MSRLYIAVGRHPCAVAVIELALSLLSGYVLRAMAL
jgi:hypothetical protein